MEFDPIHQEALNKLSQTNCTVFLDRLYIPNRQSLFPNYSIEREREKIPIPFAAKKLHTRSLEHLVGNRTISKIESNQSGNCVIVRVPVGKGGGVQHGGTSSADEYTHQGALNEKLHRERPVCPPHPSRHSSGCQEQRERERESGRASVCIRSVSTGRNATRIRR